MVLINGVADDKISVFDRALQYGDGLFETIAVINRQLHNWDKHYQRLALGAEKLALDYPDENLLKNEIEQILGADSNKLEKRKIIKIILSRGLGGRGYAIPDKQINSRIISLHAWPEYPLSFYLEGVDIAEIPFRLAKQGSLAGLKTLNRLEQVLAKKSLSQSSLETDFQEAIVLNCEEHVIEGISSNIYFVNDGVLCLPTLNQSGIAGTIRSQVIELCQQKEIAFTVSDYELGNLSQATEVFLSNSIIGLWPVKSLSFLNNNERRNFSPGLIYQRLAAIINTQLLYSTLNYVHCAHYAQ